MLMIVAERLAAVLAEVLADAVVDDDGVVHRVADDGEHGGDGRERHFLVEDDERAEDDERVVDAGEHDARREPQVEAEREVEHDEHDRDGDRVTRAVAQLLAGLRDRPTRRGARDRGRGRRRARCGARRGAGRPCSGAGSRRGGRAGSRPAGCSPATRSFTFGTVASCCLSFSRSGFGVVADGELVAAGAELQLGGARVLRTASASLALDAETERLAAAPPCVDSSTVLISWTRIR